MLEHSFLFLPLRGRGVGLFFSLTSLIVLSGSVGFRFVQLLPYWSIGMVTSRFLTLVVEVQCISFCHSVMLLSVALSQ